MNLFQYRVTHVEWWGCLTDYPSSWPWASQHRPCFGIGIYCFQSEPIPENHLKIFWFCVWKNCELSSCWCTCHLKTHDIYLWYEWCPASISYLPNCQIQWFQQELSYTAWEEDNSVVWLDDSWMYGLHIYTWFVASNFEFLHKRIPTSTLSPDIV